MPDDQLIPWECIVAKFMFEHPGQEVSFNNSILVYNNELGYFQYFGLHHKNPRWLRARGMDAWLASAARYFSD